MKKLHWLGMMVLLLIAAALVAGCAQNASPDDPPQQAPADVTAPEPPEQTGDQEQVSDPVGPSIVPPTDGTDEIFEFNGLSLEISNVKDIKIKQGRSLEGEESWEIWEYDIYVVYPGAIIKILKADTFIEGEDRIPHVNWAFQTSDGERIDIVDDMEPVEITEDIVGIYSVESSVYLLGFEIYSANEDS